MSTTELATISTDNIVQEKSVSGTVFDGILSVMKLVLKNTFPDPIDGLKRVHIRALYVSIDSDIFNKKVKTAKLVSRTNEIHPYGDAPTFDAIAKLAQPWVTDPPLYIIDGNGGSYMDSDTAQPRYIDIELTDFAKEVFFGDISIKSLPMTMGESLKYEPKYFVPALPTALLYAYTTIGIGYQSKPISLNFTDVCDLVYLYSQHMVSGSKDEFDYLPHLHKLLPDFPTYSCITNVNYLLEQYKNNNFTASIHLDGNIHIFKDRIVIHSLPHGSSFDDLQHNIQQSVIKSKKDTDNFLDKVVDTIASDKMENPSKAHLIIKLKRGVDPFLVYEKLKIKFMLSNTYVPNPNYTYGNDELYLLNPIQIIKLWIKERCEILRASKVKQIKYLTEQIEISNASIIALKNKDDVVKILTSTPSLAEATKQLMDKYNFTWFQCNYILHLHLQSINPECVGKYEADVIAQNEKLDSVYNQLANIAGEVGETALVLKRKYSKAFRKTEIPAYIGYVQFESGYIQFSNINELQEILDEFNKFVYKVFLYHSDVHTLVVDSEERVKKDQDNHKYGTGFLLKFKENPLSRKHLNTIKLSDTICYVKEIVPKLNTSQERYFYIKDKAIFIHRSGKVERSTIHAISSVRKNINTSGAITTITYMLSYTEKPFYLAIMCPKNKNTIRICKVNPDKNRIKIPPDGEVFITHHINTTSPWIINVEQSCLSRNTTNCVLITNVDVFFGKNDFVDIDLNSNFTKKLKNVKLF